MKEENVKDLWPDDIGKASEPNTPVALLREQAEVLTRKTKGLIEGRVETTGGEFDAGLIHRFLLKPVSFNYTFELFTMEQEDLTKLYPVVLNWKGRSFRVDSEDVLIDCLRNTFASEETRNAIQSLLAQSVA